MKKIRKTQKTEFETEMEQRKVSTQEMQEKIKNALESVLSGTFEIEDETFINYNTDCGQYFIINVVNGDDVLKNKRVLIYNYRKGLILQHKRIDAEMLSDELNKMIITMHRKK